MLVQKLRESGVLFLGLLLSGATGVSASALDETVNILEQWVQTEREISESRSAWEQERASMQDLIAIYRDESSQLDQVIAEAADDVGVAEARRSELLAQDSELKRIEGQVLEKIIATEVRIKSLEKVLPTPLQEELATLFRLIPSKPAESKLAIGQRIQPIAAILTQIQKFNQSVTIVEGFREFEAGRTVQTEKVFFGLGTAYYVDGANEHAGYGVLGEAGWKWVDDDTLVPVVRQFVEIYRGTRQAAYLPMPYNLK